MKVPSKSGYGTKVVADLVPYELGGTTNFALTPEGVRCRLKIPARWFSTGLSQAGEKHKEQLQTLEKLESDMLTFREWMER